MGTRTLEEVEQEIEATKEALSHVRGTETEVYARIVGYYRAVKNWNKGKRDEFNQRKLFSLEADGLYSV
ncbi:MAG: anaerobic ribonucleoside-triphosphate reductase, partial [Treponemataceae bacterium]|nr:anaerobic ribonucleoside-triphosphate reductase [Treponemataceae bacterium]